MTDKDWRIRILQYTPSTNDLVEPYHTAQQKGGFLLKRIVWHQKVICITNLCDMKILFKDVAQQKKLEQHPRHPCLNTETIEKIF